MSEVSAQRLRFPLTSPHTSKDTTGFLWRPAGEDGGAAFVLGHGAGANAAHPTMLALGRGLAGRGHPVLTFNFGYAEAGRRAPDPTAWLESAFRDAAGVAREAFGRGRPLILGGRSMGGRIASQLAARGEPCAGLALLSYPLHPARWPERLRTAHWPRIRVPVLFVQGDRDRLCPLPRLDEERRVHLAVPVEVDVLPGADHAYATRGDGCTPRPQTLERVAGALATWAERLPLTTSA
ncbi:MAG: alpha/beta fold hydrolase [Actinobacteria bacterium]|nr:alpha/beta fold hydrolase [Actinomycetota bacterium]